MRRFEDKKVVITGGTKGIGLQIAKHFLDEGASVAILGRCPDRGEAACKGLSGDISFYSVDVSNHKKVKEFSDKLLEKWGKIDVLVNMITMPPPKTHLDKCKQQHACPQQHEKHQENKREAGITM